MAVEVVEVVRRDHAELLEQRPRQADVRGDLVAVLGEQLRQHVLAVERGRARTQVRWLRPTWSTSTRSGSTPSSRANAALEADRHVAEPDRAVPGVEQRARDDPDRVREVDDPRVGRRRSSRTRSAISSTTGTVRSALAKPPAPVVSWPMQPQASGTVSSESRAAWPPTRIWIKHEVGAVDARGRGRR